MQQIICCLLYYAYALDNTIFVAFSTLTQTQEKTTSKTKQFYNHLLSYCAIYLNVGPRYHASDMILNTDSDASYRIAPEAKSRIAGYFYLNNKTSSSPNNAPILVECLTPKHVVTSSAECEMQAYFTTQKQQFPFITSLIKLDINNHQRH